MNSNIRFLVTKWKTFKLSSLFSDDNSTVIGSSFFDTFFKIKSEKMFL